MQRAAMRHCVVDTNKLIASALREVKLEAKGREIEWKIEDLPDVQADPPMLRLVFCNLIANAVKYTRSRQRAFIEIKSRVEPHEIIFACVITASGLICKTPQISLAYFSACTTAKILKARALTRHRAAHRASSRRARLGRRQRRQWRLLYFSLLRHETFDARERACESTAYAEETGVGH
jgi:hypothetical protein